MRYKRPAYTARKFLKVPQFQRESIKKIADIVDKECISLTSKSSILSTGKSNYIKFNWNSLLKQLESCAPNLMAVLKAASKYNCLSITSKIRLCTAASILLFSRSQILSTVQIFIGSILYAGHAAKKVCKMVYNCLQHTFLHRCIHV